MNQNYNVFLKVYVLELKECNFLLSLRFVCPDCVAASLLTWSVWHTYASELGVPECQSAGSTPSRREAVLVCISTRNATSVAEGRF